MIRFYKISLILVFSIIFISCSDNDDNVELSNGNYLIFGHFYGMCFGEECIETFKLTNSKLYEDTNDNYSHDSFKFEELSLQKFEAVKDLLEFLPPELLTETESFIGCPDCADQGGIFIQYKNGESVQSWKIDQSKSQVPKYLHSFIDKVNEKINTINN
jgi:hypothetical protein